MCPCSKRQLEAMDQITRDEGGRRNNRIMKQTKHFVLLLRFFFTVFYIGPGSEPVICKPRKV